MEILLSCTSKKAFYDLLEESVLADKPDYDWLVKLYRELKKRICKYILPNSKKREIIETSFDVEFFEQLIRNEVFDFIQIQKLIINTFGCIKELQSPFRDKIIKKSMEKVLSTDFTRIVPEFIKEANKCLDFLDEDMYNFVYAIKNRPTPSPPSSPSSM